MVFAGLAFRIARTGVWRLGGVLGGRAVFDGAIASRRVTVLRCASQQQREEEEGKVSHKGAVLDPPTVERCLLCENNHNCEVIVQKSTGFHPINWDHLRFLLALAEHGTLSGAARVLGVDHSTVGRRVDAAEAALGLRLFTRSVSGYALTPDGERLLPPLRSVDTAVQGLRRAAQAREQEVAGPVRVSCPETLGMTWLAQRLAEFGAAHPKLQLHVDPTGRLADLARGEAEIAIRNVRATQQRLVVLPLAEVRCGLYASEHYLSRVPADGPLEAHRFLAPPAAPGSVEGAWLQRLCPGAQPVLVSELSITLAAAAQVHAGVAILPEYLGRSTPGLLRLGAAVSPPERLWLTVHEDARKVARVRALMAFLRQAFEEI